MRILVKSYTKKTKSQLRNGIGHGKRTPLPLKLHFLDTFPNSFTRYQEIKLPFFPHFKCYLYHISPNTVTLTS